MPTLTSGDQVVDFTLKSIQGKQYSSEEARESGLVLIAFYKVNCPTCQLMLPYVDKLYQAYKSDQFQAWGISQNPLEYTIAFIEKYGTSLPMLLDEGLKATVAYDLVAVPTVYLLDGSDQIRWSQVGWNSDAVNTLSIEIARFLGAEPVTIVKETDNVPAFKAG